MRTGRPSKETEALTLRLPREVLQEIDDIRRVEDDVPNRQEMIRRIIADWIERRRDSEG